MNQLPLIDLPRARATDPISSHEAGEYIRDSGGLAAQQDRAWKAVRLWPGCTARELAHHLAGRFGGSELALYASLHKRLAELDGIKVKTGESRKCKHSGRTCQTWWLL